MQFWDKSSVFTVDETIFAQCQSIPVRWCESGTVPNGLSLVERKILKANALVDCLMYNYTVTVTTVARWKEWWSRQRQLQSPNYRPTVLGAQSRVQQRFDGRQNIWLTTDCFACCHQREWIQLGKGQGVCKSAEYSKSKVVGYYSQWIAPKGWQVWDIPIV